MTGGRFLPAVILLALITATSAASASDGLHPSLYVIEGWLGEWHGATLSGEPTQVDYRAALGGRFIEAWHRNPTNGELRAHSMIGADPDGDVLTEYRFDDRGRDGSIPPPHSPFVAISTWQKTRYASAAFAA